MDESLEDTGLAGLSSNTESISKGVFAFRRGTKRNSTNQDAKKKKSRKKRSKPENTADDVPEFFGKSANAKFRFDLYNQTWDKISNKMKNLQKYIFDKVLLDVIEFCQQSKKTNDSTIVPTCALVTGVNLPDHTALFKLLVKSIKKGVSEHIAIVRSSECGTLKILVKKILLQLHKINSEFDESSDEESEGSDDESETLKSKKGANKFVPTLSNMVTWYENQYGSGVESSNTRPPLVVIFEDFEGFSAPMLQDLIANLQACRENLPFLLIFGVATTVDVIHRSLPHGTTSKMAIHSFASAPSIHLLAKFVEALVMDTNIPFKLGGRVLKTLLETFSFHDLSVNHFLMGLKLCLLEHFSTKEPTVLCCSKSARNEAVNLVKLKQLSKPQIEMSKAKDFDLKTELVKVDEKMLLFNSFVAALHAIVAKLPRAPLGKNFHHVYNLAMSEPVTQTHEYREAFQYLKMSERIGLIETLTTFSQSLRKNGETGEILEAAQKAESFIKELEDMQNSVVSNDSPILSSNVKSLQDLKAESPNKKLDRESLKQVLLEQAREKKVKKMNVYELLRENIMNFIHETLKKHLENMPSKWIWHDIFYFDDVNIIKKMLMGAPRNVVQLALKTPYHYLKVPNLEAIKKDEIPTVLPDISIAYKLHLECGRLINLFDWLQCWLYIVNNDIDPDDKEPVEEGKVVSERMHARFSHAVSELQFLGFIKPSKRKTDHVERLTF